MPQGTTSPGTINLDCPTCFANIVVADDGGNGVLETFGLTGTRNIAFDSPSIDRLNRVFFDTPVKFAFII